jgi:predicted thioesterase
VTATVVDAEGRKIAFELDARDDAGPIAHARHDRVIVDRARFERLLDGGR